MAAVRSRFTVALLLAAGVLLAVVLASTGGADGHRVFVEVPDAVNVIAGQKLLGEGEQLGEVESLEARDGGRAARITLRVDEEAWPLRRGARLRLRWGGTIAYNNRYIEVRPGPEDAEPLRDDATLPSSAFEAPVEFDELLGTFAAPARRNLKAMLDNAGAALGEAERPLRRALNSAPPAVGEAAALLGDLESESADLQVLVRSLDSVVAAADDADPGLGRLVAGASATFNATAAQAEAIGEALHETPGTLTAARTTLERADATLSSAAELTRELAPGVDEAAELAAPLQDVLATLVRVGPDARKTLAAARRAAPSLTPLLGRLTALMPTIGSVAKRTAEELRCVRPYSPEIASFFSTWGDRINNSDGKDRYGRALVQVPPFQNAQIDDSAAIAANNPDLVYAYPHPPGVIAGQPWFLPECGVGPEALDPTKDPEARPFDPASFVPWGGAP